MIGRTTGQAPDHTDDGRSTRIEGSLGVASDRVYGHAGLGQFDRDRLHTADRAELGRRAGLDPGGAALAGIR